MTLAVAVALYLAGLLAGAINAVAGGGTLITFPTLLAVGVPPITANATSAVALVPGSLASGWAFRRELDAVRPWIKWFVPASFVGGGLGGLLLLATPERIFQAAVPYFILLATGLFAFAKRSAEILAGHERRGPEGHRGVWLATLAQVGVGIYGGYFGGGMGIMMLAVMGMLELGTIHEANALKALCGTAINATAAGVFLFSGLVSPEHALVMVAGTVTGGIVGVHLGRRVGPGPVRAFVIVAGLVTAAKMLLG
jgi:uncharacterized membrane protein YfcA